MINRKYDCKIILFILSSSFKSRCYFFRGFFFFFGGWGELCVAREDVEVQVIRG